MKGKAGREGRERERTHRRGTGSAHPLLPLPAFYTPGHAALTPGVPAQDEFANLIIDEDEETVGEGTEPPAGPAEAKEEEGI